MIAEKSWRIWSMGEESYVMAASDGRHTYRVTADTCTCAGYHFRGCCRHTKAARILCQTRISPWGEATCLMEWAMTHPRPDCPIEKLAWGDEKEAARLKDEISVTAGLKPPTLAFRYPDIWNAWVRSLQPCIAPGGAGVAPTQD